MAEKIVKLGIKREAGFLYFLRGSDVWKVPMKRAGAPSAAGLAVCVANSNFEREYGYLYFLDAHGDICRAKDARKQQKRSQKAKISETTSVSDKKAKKKQEIESPSKLASKEKLSAVQTRSKPTTEKSPAPVKRPQRHSLRNLIDKILLDDPLLNAFCCDFFPDIFKSFNQGMNRLEKITLLLIRVDSTDKILNNLRMFDEESFLEHEGILKYE